MLRNTWHIVGAPKVVTLLLFNVFKQPLQRDTLFSNVVKYLEHKVFHLIIHAHKVV